MSFLRDNSASTGLGNLIGVAPSQISSIANSVGNVANGIAAAGGATQGYGGQAAPTNYMQLSDPSFIQAVMAKVGSQPSIQSQPLTYSGPSTQSLAARLPGYFQ